MSYAYICCIQSPCKNYDILDILFYSTFIKLDILEYIVEIDFFLVARIQNFVKKFNFVISINNNVF